RTTECSAQVFDRATAEETAKRTHDANIGAGESVDALPVIPHHAQIRVRFLGNGPQQARTGERRVLVLISNHQLEWALVVPLLRVANGQVNHVVEIDSPGLA